MARRAEVSDGCTLDGLLASTGYIDRKIAVEINREIVPKSLHAVRALRENDSVEIVHAIGGG